MPVYPYKVRTKDGLKERTFSIREFRVNECPVSIISKPYNSRKPGFIGGAKAAELVRLWHHAKASKTTLTKLLGSRAAWIEDVQTTFDAAQAAIDAAHRNAIESRVK